MPGVSLDAAEFKSISVISELNSEFNSFNCSGRLGTLHIKTSKSATEPREMVPAQRAAGDE